MPFYEIFLSFFFFCVWLIFFNVTQWNLHNYSYLTFPNCSMDTNDKKKNRNKKNDTKCSLTWSIFMNIFMNSLLFGVKHGTFFFHKWFLCHTLYNIFYCYLIHIYCSLTNKFDILFFEAVIYWNANNSFSK